MNDHGRPNRLQTDHPSPPPLRQPQDVTHVHHHEYFSPVMDRTRISLATLESGKQIWRLRTQRSRRLESLTRRQLRLFQYLDQEHQVRNCNPKHSSVSWEGELGDRQTNENVVTPDSPLTLDDVSSNYEEGQSQITEASILEEKPHCGPTGILNFHEGAEKFHKISCDIPSIHLGISNQCIWLDFGGAEINRVGRIRSLSFLAQAPVHNRNDTIQTTDACVYPLEFEFDSFPFESGFDVSMIDPTSKHSSSEDLHPPVGVQLREGEFKQFFITWNPIKLGGVREVIHLTTPGGMNQIVVVGNAGNDECNCFLQETENRISDLIQKEVSLDVTNVIVRGDSNDDGRRNSGHRHLDNPDVIVTDSQVDGHDTILSDYETSATSAPNDENIANHTSMTSESIIHNNSSNADSHRDERSTHDNIKTNAEGDGLRIQKKMGHDGGKDGESGLHVSNSISLNGKETNSDIFDVNGSCYESQDDTSGKFVEAINVSRSGSDCADVNNECKTSEKEVDVDEIYHHDVGRQCLVGAHVDDVGASRDKLADQSFDYPELDYVGGNAEKYETAGEVTDTGICTDVHSTYSSECRVDGTGTMPNGHDNDSSKSVHSQTDPSSSINVSKINDLLPNGEIEDEEGNDDSSDNLSCELRNGSYSQKRSYEIDSRCFKYVETRPLDQKTLAEPVEEGSLYLQTMTFVDSLIGDATVADESHFSELESLTNESVHKVQTVKDQVQNNDGEYKQEVQLNKHFTFDFETCDNQESNEHMLEDKDEKEDQGQADAPSCESAGSDSDESIIPRDISAMVLEMEKELQDVTDFVSMTGDTPKSKTLPLEDDYSDSEEEVDSVPQGLGRTFSNDSSAHLIMLNDQVADDLLLHSNRDDVHVDHYAFETTEKSADVGSASLKTQTTPKNEDALNSNLCSSTLHDSAAASIPATSSVSSPMANASPLVSIKTDSQSNHKISSLSDIAMENKHVSSAKQPIKAPESPRTITRKTARMYYFYKSPKEDSTKKKKNKKKRVNPNNRSPLFSSDKAIEQRIDTKHYDELSLKRKRDFIVHQRSISLEPSFNGAERRVHSRLSATPSSTTSVKKTSETTRKQNYAENGAGMETEKLQHDAAESNQQQHTKSNTLSDQPTTEDVDSDREQTRSNYHDALESNPVNATTSGASLNNTPISINKNRNKLRLKRFSTPHYSSKSKDFNVGVLSDTKTSRKSFSPSHLATLKFENPMSAMISEIVTESAQSCYFYRPPEKTVSKGTSSRHLRSPRVPRTSFEDSTASSRAKIIPDTPYAKLKYGQGSVKHLSLHSRCEVQPGSRRGEIAYIGAIDELGGGGYWVGVILDEPVGKTDGTVQSSGVRYFEAPGSRRGGFFRGKNVEVGDFPCIDVINELDGVDE